MFDLSHEIRDFWMKKKPFFLTPTYKKWPKKLKNSAKETNDELITTCVYK